MKLCSKCKKVKRNKEFYKRLRYKSGLNSACKVCERERNSKYLRKWRKENLGKCRDRQREYKRKNRKRYRVYMRKYLLRTAYGMSLRDFTKLLAEQDGVCAICGTDQPGQKSFNVDHDHETGEIRGLLCAACNRALGLLKDDPAIVESAFKYLRK